ncbi:MAG TPA: TIGR03621 family F420-dependent LLM class oxidoreductase [Acidimicrobiales bacterium]
MHPFRFGVQASRAASGPAWRDLARRVEELGYSTLYVPDHLGDQWGPLVALTVAAEATERLRVGSLVFGNDYRHPLFLAKEMATLDLVSEGRTEFGIGAGWMRSDYDEAGLSYDRPGRRVDRLQEAVAIIKGVWSEGKVSVAGEHYQIADATGAPPPRSNPHPPIVIGGGSPRVLALAAREADIVGINPSLAAGYVGPEVAATATAAHYRQRVSWVREAAGKRFDELELQMLSFAVQVVPNGRELLESMAPAFGLSTEEILEVPIALVGTVDEICETIVRRREEYGFSYWVVHDGDIDAFAPVVARLAGT